MKKVLGFVLLAVTVSAPAFGGDAVGRSASVVGKDSAKVATATARDTAKAGVKVVKVLF
jgi:hypothetical protein